MMDCETYRRRLLENPDSSSGILDAHRRACPACAAHAERLWSAERKIGEALRFDVERLSAYAAAAAEPAPPSPEHGRLRRLIALGGLAATFAGAIALYAVLAGGPTLPTEPELAAAVVDHWHEDTAARELRYGRIDARTLREALADQVDIDAQQLGPITYASSCYVLGVWVPHLSIRGTAGPIMVVLFPNRRVDRPVPFQLASHGLRGRIVPAGDGSIAILADELEPLEPLGRRLVAAVSWAP